MGASPKVIAVIPARLDSKRLTRKVLRRIAGKAMVHWVYEHARQAQGLAQILVATDSPEVLEYCQDHGIPAMMTGEHPSGSDRLYEVMERTDGDIYVNIQGDEPTLGPDHINRLLAPVLAGEAEVATLKVTIDRTAAQNPNHVKVVTDMQGRALYFSRCPVPYDRDEVGEVAYFKHIGVYAYTRAALQRFHSLAQSSLECAEKLEQLRYLQNGIAVHVVETPQDTIGVDTESDLERVIALFSGPESAGSPEQEPR
jgi:3-deoxy-manno-octulosonate cytidylyltransferase (CMP-KDO synthetase)